ARLCASQLPLCAGDGHAARLGLARWLRGSWRRYLRGWRDLHAERGALVCQQLWLRGVYIRAKDVHKGIMGHIAHLSIQGTTRTRFLHAKVLPLRNGYHTAVFSV